MTMLMSDMKHFAGCVNFQITEVQDYNIYINIIISRISTLTGQCQVFMSDTLNVFK